MSVPSSVPVDGERAEFGPGGVLHREGLVESRRAARERVGADSLTFTDRERVVRRAGHEVEAAQDRILSDRAAADVEVDDTAGGSGDHAALEVEVAGDDAAGGDIDRSAGADGGITEDALDVHDAGSETCLGGGGSRAKIERAAAVFEQLDERDPARIEVHDAAGEVCVDPLTGGFGDDRRTAGIHVECGGVTCAGTHVRCAGEETALGNSDFSAGQIAADGASIYVDVSVESHIVCRAVIPDGFGTVNDAAVLFPAVEIHGAACSHHGIFKVAVLIHSDGIVNVPVADDTARFDPDDAATLGQFFHHALIEDAIARDQHAAAGHGHIVRRTAGYIDISGAHVDAVRLRAGGNEKAAAVDLRHVGGGKLVQLHDAAFIDRRVLHVALGGDITRLVDNGGQGQAAAAFHDGVAQVSAGPGDDAAVEDLQIDRAALIDLHRAAGENAGGCVLSVTQDKILAAAMDSRIVRGTPVVDVQFSVQLNIGVFDDLTV